MIQEKIINKLVMVRSIYLGARITTIIKYSIISLVIILAFFIRILPLRFGAFISEFDPYIQFYGAKVIVKGFEEKGLAGLFDFFSHHIDLTWQPYGVDLAKAYWPGVPYLGALTYIFLSLLGIGVSLVDVAIYLPVLFGILAVYFIYLIGNEIGGEVTGFVASLFYAVSPSITPRSNLGWYDTDGFGMPFLIMSIYFFIKSIKSSNIKEKIIYALFAGIFAGILGGTWGGFIYLYAMYALYTLLIILFYKIPENYELSYILMIFVTNIIVNNVPKNGLTYLTGVFAIIQYAVITLLILTRYIDIKSLYGTVVRFIASLFLISLALFIITPILPIQISGRYLAVILPFYEGIPTVVKTVQEQAGASFVYYYRGLFILIPFSIYGFYLLFKERSYDKIFVALFALTSLYTSSNFVRLIILASPFVMLLGGYGIQKTFVLLYQKLFSPTKTLKKKSSREKISIKTQVIAATLVIVLLGTYYTYNVGIKGATYPVTLVTGGSINPSPSYDWFEALEWMKANIPNNSVVASWWDYGYWISIIGGKRSLADNGTINSTRISLLAEMFLSDESHAIKILKELGAEYILIYLGTVDVSTQQDMSFFIFYGFGEEGKFAQMARILGQDPNQYMNGTNANEPIYTDAFWNTFLGKLIPYQFVQKQGQLDIYRYSPKYATQPNASSKIILVYRTTDPGWGEVVIYKLVDNT